MEYTRKRGQVMTREEAKQVLENELKANCKTCMHPQEVGYCEHTCTYREAMETAISALQAEPKVAYACDGRRCGADCSDCGRTTDIEHAKNFTKVCDLYFEKLQTEPSDLISREEAIETAKELVMFWSDPVYIKEKESDVEDSFNDIPSAEQVTSKLKNPYDSLLTEDSAECKEQKSKLEHDREWIIGCIKHDGFIKTDRFDKANQIILDALADRPSGEWLEIEDYNGDYHYQCSACKDEFYIEYGTPKENGYTYCPSCGARMEGGGE